MNFLGRDVFDWSMDALILLSAKGLSGHIRYGQWAEELDRGLLSMIKS